MVTLLVPALPANPRALPLPVPLRYPAAENIYFAYGAHYEATRRARDGDKGREDGHDSKRPRGEDGDRGGGDAERGGWTKVA